MVVDIDMKRVLPSEQYPALDTAKRTSALEASHLAKRTDAQLNSRTEPMQVDAAPCPSPSCIGLLSSYGEVKVCSHCSVQMIRMSDLEASYYFHSSSGCALTPRFRKQSGFGELRCYCGFLEYVVV